MNETQTHFEFDEYVKVKHNIIFDSQNDETKVWPERDVEALEDFCRKYGIVGYNCGRMNPIAAIAMLKQKLGITDTSLKEITPYSNAINNKKILLNG